MKMIEIEGLSKSFGNVKAVEDLSFSVGEGELFAFLGVNGAGKSTTISIMSGLIREDAGTVRIAGMEMCDDVRRMIGVVHQGTVLDKALTVKSNLKSRAALYGIFGEDFERRLRELSTLLELDDILARPFGKLSGGQKRRADIARALFHRPRLLILDEPFSGFDPVNAQLIREEILRLKDEGATIILSTHNMESVEELCDNIALINKSHVVITGGVDEIRRKYGNNNVELIYTGTALKPAAGVFDVLSDNDDAGRHTAVLALESGYDTNKALREILQQDVTVNSFKELVPRMNDIFIKLVTEEE